MNYSSFIPYLAIMFITPGPSNLTSLYLGAKYGIRGAQRFIIESSTGFFVKFMLCAFLNLWLASVIPAIMPVMKWAGAAYMLYFTYGLLKAGFAPEKENAEGERKADYPSGLMLQLVNMKSWITNLSIPAVYVIPYSSEIKYMFIAAGLTMVFMLSTTYIWCVSGKVLNEVYRKHKKAFSVFMALGMLYCIVTAVM